MDGCPRGRRSTIGNRVDGDNSSRGFKSHSIRHPGPLVKRFNTAAFHAVIQGFESPTGHHYNQKFLAKRCGVSWRLSSAGRASALQAEGRRFDPVSLHHIIVAGWSSSVARRAHNPKVAGSNPAPATNLELW